MTDDAPVRSRAATALLLTGALLIVAATTFAVLRYRLYHVESDSMRETLLPGDRIVSDTSYEGGADIRRGDVVMLDKAAWPGEPELSELVKRVVAVGGDTVSYSARGGRLRVNGKPLTEDYLARGMVPAYDDFSVTVPAGRLYVLGDNRPSSMDSREYRGDKRGTVAASAVHGRVVAIAYPLDRTGELPATGTFGSPRHSETTLFLVAGGALAGLILLIAAGLETLRVRLSARHR